MINSEELKEVTRKIHKGNTTSTEERIYNYYVASWGI